MSDDAYNDDALNNDADYKAERFKAFREEMEKIGYSIAGEIDLCIGKGIRFRKTSDIGHKMTFADWVEAKRAKGEEINFIGQWRARSSALSSPQFRFEVGGPANDPDNCGVARSENLFDELGVEMVDGCTNFRRIAMGM